MELSLSMKLRIAAAAAVGVVVIGIAAWPMAKPAEPFGAVCLSSLGLDGAVILLALAFAVGLVGYFAAWPHGREIGILAVPAGLIIWAVRTGSMASQIQMSPALRPREALLGELRLEPVFWLAVIGAGFLGVLSGRKMCPSPADKQPENKPKLMPAQYLNAALAIVASVVVAVIALCRLAQDISMTNGALGSVMGQPAIGQIVFGTIVAFGLAGFIVKHFLNAGYIWPIIATCLVTPFAIITYAKHDALNHLANNWPAVFFSNAAIAILPVQMVVFGTIGAIAGYWTAIRYDFWRKHEI